MVNFTKYIQGLSLQYMIVRTYRQGDAHDLFNASFALFKYIFNVVDATMYFNQKYEFGERIKTGYDLMDLWIIILLS